MKEIGSILHSLGGMPGMTLIAVIILSAFALAGFAIYAVCSVIRETKT
jgi:hypothetical protein